MSGVSPPPRSDDETCAVIRLAATASIDGEASELETAIVRRHVATCADCRSALDRHLRVARRVRQAPLVRPRRRPLSRRVRHRRALVGVAIAASLGVGGLAGALIADSGRNSQSPLQTRTGPVIAERPGPGPIRPAG